MEGVMSAVIWHEQFGPSYSPMQMIEKGVFMDCHYNVAIEGMSKDWYKHPKVYPRSKEPDETKNFYGVKSRQSLSVWKENGWTTKHSPLGWWQWYCLYFQGRRLEKEDEWQIKRWRSFVARHQGQINSNCTLGDKSCRPKQRQGLLQWGWDSSSKISELQIKNNARKLAALSGVSLESHYICQPSDAWMYLCED